MGLKLLASQVARPSKSTASGIAFPKGSSTQYLGTWDFGNRNFSTGLG